MKNNHTARLFPSLALGLLLAFGFARAAFAAPVRDPHSDNISPRLLTAAESSASIVVPGQTLLHLYYTPTDAPAMPPSRVTVPAGDRVVVQGNNAPADWPVQWSKNGQPIPGAISPFLTIASASAADAGVYTATFNVPSGKPVITQALVLGVAPAERLANLSTWTSLPAGLGEGVIAGFVVNGGSAPKKMIVRAIGPSLAQFGFGHTLRLPTLRIRDATGKLYENGYVYPAAIGGRTYESDLAESLAKVGAFPTLPGATDAVRLAPFVPGNYTVEVTSGDNTAGAVLLEIYEVP